MKEVYVGIISHDIYIYITWSKYKYTNTYILYSYIIIYVYLYTYIYLYIAIISYGYNMGLKGSKLMSPNQNPKPHNWLQKFQTKNSTPNKKTHETQKRHCEHGQLSWKRDVLCIIVECCVWREKPNKTPKRAKTSPYIWTCDRSNKTLSGNQGSPQPGAPRSPRVSRTSIKDYMSETSLKTSSDTVT